MLLQDKVAVSYGAGGVAMFMASDKASGMTGTTVNLSMGALAG